MYRYIATCWIGLLLLLPSLRGQTVAPEHIWIETAQPLISPGETLWYSLSLDHPDDSLPSRIVHVDWVGEKGQVLEHQKLRIEGRHAQGQIELPSDGTAGTYVLRAYTRWNLNFGPQGIFGRRISVCALPELSDLKAPPSPPAHSVETEPQGDLRLSLTLSEAELALRQPVQVRIQAQDAAGQAVAGTATVKVYAAGMMPDGVSLAEAVPAPFAAPAALDWAPERALVLSGQARKMDADEALTSTGLSVYLVGQRRNIWGKSLAGKVVLSCPDLYEEQVLQVFDINPFGQQGVRFDPIALDPSAVGDMRQINWQAQSLPDASWINWYGYHAAKRQQFAQIFAQPIAPRRLRPPLDSSAHYAPDFVFDKAQYLPFRDLEEFVKEAMVPFVKLKKVNGKRSLRLLNLDTKRRNKSAPAYLVNNYLTLQEADALGIPYDEIRRISVYGQYGPLFDQYGPIGAQGVLAIETRSGQAPSFVQQASNAVKWKGLSFPQPFPAPAYDLLSARIRLEQSPDLRPLLSWKANLALGTDGVATWQWFHNDLHAPIRVAVLFESEAGQRVRAEITYQVPATH